ncbi:MAG: NAD(P)-dependent dehydrogenase (short-subunit alcohol dehydrogenase family) [Bacteroidia bacterium]|jgi:NAD(P)-dependent dehydrogenase (short-subunit alcohol dehydrogenase family)
MKRIVILVALAWLSVAAQAVEQAPPTALVTGANRGIGLELVTQLKSSGYRVIGTARKPFDAAQLRALGVQVEQLDVTDGASVAAMAERLQGVPIDLLINNAGVGGDGGNQITDTDFDQLALLFAVNSTGPMRVTQALLDNLTAGQGKTVIQISSIMGSVEKNWGGAYGYRASKAALNIMNKSLAIELGKQGFTCVVLHPGWVKTRMGGESAPVVPVDSVAGMLAVIKDLKPSDTGRFLDYQGDEIPW